MCARDGEKTLTTADCDECDREFECWGTWDVEFHDGYGTRRELSTDETICKDCRGEGRCEGTFEYRKGGLIDLVRIPCDADGKTRICIEDSGSKTVLGVFCDKCHAWYAEDDE